MRTKSKGEMKEIRRNYPRKRVLIPSIKKRDQLWRTKMSKILKAKRRGPQVSVRQENLHLLPINNR